MVPKKLKPLNIRKKAVNIAFTAGRKERNEKSCSQFCRTQSKTYLKRPIESLKAVLISEAPIFKTTIKKVGKSAANIPSIFNAKSRIYYGLKTMLFYKKNPKPNLQSRLNLYIKDFSFQIKCDSILKLENVKKSFEQKTLAHFRWFK